MKFIPLHTTNTAIIYKNAICSTATMLVLSFFVLSIMIPVILVSLLSPYSGIAESRVLFEQPNVRFQYKSMFLGSTAANELVVCSTFPNLNEGLIANGAKNKCDGVKYWTEDFDFDGTIDSAHFVQQIESLPNNLVSFDMILFFEITLKHKCPLNPPAILTQHVELPAESQFPSGVITIKADLSLKQYIEFTCPFPGRYAKTKFHHIDVSDNATDVSQYTTGYLLDQIKSNPAYFQLDVQERHMRKEAADKGLTIRLDMDILQLGARYHLSVWERLGQFWLYFASFFGISFYIMNKIKDFLFGNHIVRSWEVIPWKKLY